MLMTTSHSKHLRSQSSEQQTLLWWSRLTRLATLNILMWLWTYSLHQNNDDFHTKMHLRFSGIYVMVCAYRSVYPRIDLERICLFDLHISNIFLGRAAATVAEICFSGQIALLLYKLGAIYGHPNTQMISFLIVPAIIIAQACCWRGVITLDYIWHAIEESIWAVSSALVGACFASIVIHGTARKDLWYLSLIGVIFSFLYFAFMVQVDIPMYYKRYKETSRKPKMDNIYRGLKDTWSRRVVTKTWSVWREEAPWLTGYFSFAVWTSIGLVHLKC